MKEFLVRRLPITCLQQGYVLMKDQTKGECFLESRFAILSHSETESEEDFLKNQIKKLKNINEDIKIIFLEKKPPILTEKSSTELNSMHYYKIKKEVLENIINPRHLENFYKICYNHTTICKDLIIPTKRVEIPVTMLAYQFSTENRDILQSEEFKQSLNILKIDFDHCGDKIIGNFCEVLHLIEFVNHDLDVKYSFCLICYLFLDKDENTTEQSYDYLRHALCGYYEEGREPLRIN